MNGQSVAWALIGIFCIGAGGCSQEPDPSTRIPTLQVQMKTDRGFTPPEAPRFVASVGSEPSFPGTVTLGDPAGALGAEDRRYLDDTRYQTLNRYEHPWLNPQPEPAPPAKTSQKFLPVRDKPLVLAGRGYEIQSFGRHAAGRIEVQDSRFLEPRLPQAPTPVAIAHPDPRDAFMKSRRPLIFHAGATGFSKEPPPLPRSPALPSAPPARTPPPIAETRLVMQRDQQAAVVLRPGEKQWDLLRGNEKLNRRDYFAGP